jgi:hypothetical protein
MKPVMIKLNEINKYVLENYKQQGTNKIEVLENILEHIWQVWDVIILEKYVLEREQADASSK